MKKTQKGIAGRAYDSKAPPFVKDWLSGRGCGPRCKYGKPVFCTAAVEVDLCDFAVHLWLNPQLHRAIVDGRKSDGTWDTVAEFARVEAARSAPRAPKRRKNSPA